MNTVEVSEFYGITVAGSGVLHAVHGEMQDGHIPFRDELTTLCGRKLVANNYFSSLIDYITGYNARGHACQQGCNLAWNGSHDG
jgi:hypothetical protein